MHVAPSDSFEICGDADKEKPHKESPEPDTDDDGAELEYTRHEKTVAEKVAREGGVGGFAEGEEAADGEGGGTDGDEHSWKVSEKLWSGKTGGRCLPGRAADAGSFAVISLWYSDVN